MTTIEAHRAIARDPRKGVLLFLLGIGLFSLLNGTVKAQAQIFPINQIMFFRNAFALIPVLMMVRAMGGFGLLATRRPVAHTLLSLQFTASMYAIFLAYHMMPLADATAISFAQPLMVTLLSAPLLGEKVTRSRWFAVAIGLAGVLVMLKPTGEGPGLGFALAAGATLIQSTNMLEQRSLSKTDSTISIVFYTLALSALIMLPTLWFSWVQPTPMQLAGLIAMGLASGACQYLTTRALYHASAATIAPVNYTKMLWAIVIGFVWFGDVPEASILIGSAIVMASTAIIYHKADEPPPPARS